MTARTHDAFAFTFLVTSAVLFPPESLSLYTLFASLIGNIVGGMIPDLDQAGNRLWEFLPGGDFVGKVLRRLFYKHRTITHSLLGMYLIYKFLQWILPIFFNPEFVNPDILLASIMIGYFSHLIADCLTKEGVPLLFPINLDVGFPPFKKLRIKTGNWVESYIILPVLGIYLVWLIRNFYGQLVKILTVVIT